MRIAVGLVGGGHTVVDEEDYEWVSARKWKMDPSGYVYSLGKRRESLHRILAGTPKGMDTHHKDEVPWHNWRSNLEVLTPREHNERHDGPARLRYIAAMGLNRFGGRPRKPYSPEPGTICETCGAKMRRPYKWRERGVRRFCSSECWRFDWKK